MNMHVNPTPNYRWSIAHKMSFYFLSQKHGPVAGPSTYRSGPAHRSNWLPNRPVIEWRIMAGDPFRAGIIVVSKQVLDAVAGMVSRNSSDRLREVWA